MSNTPKPRSILVVDSDAAFLDSLKFGADPARLNVIGVQSGREADGLLADSSRPLAVIFVNPSVEHPSGLTVIRLAHQYRPVVPIFLIYDSQTPPFTEPELRMLGVHAAIRKPTKPSDFLEYTEPFLATEDGDLEGAVPGGPPSADEDAFFPVRTTELLSARKSYFDLFVRLGAGKFVKIMNSGEEFSGERMWAYVKKGTRCFYIKKEEQERYLSYCDQLVSGLLKNPRAALETKVTQMIRHGEETMRFLRKQGLKDSQLQHASSFVSKINELVAQVDTKKHAVFKAFLANVAAMEHGTGTAIIASLVGSSLKVVPPPQVLGVASFFHDIGLTGMPAEVQDEDESSMSAEDIKLFRSHPAIGAQILSSIENFDPLAAKAVGLHHQRLRKRGFPDLAAGAKPDPVAELVGLSDEFIRLIQKTKQNPRLNPLREMETTVFDGFSPPMVEAFRNFFFMTLLS